MTKRSVSGLALVTACTALVSGVEAGIVPALSRKEMITALDLTSDDYFIIFVAALIALNIFFVAVYKIFRRESSGREFSRLVNLLGSLSAFLCVAIGSMLIIFIVLVLITITTDINSFMSALTMFSYFFDSTVYGVIIAGGTGMLLFLIGLYLLIVLHGNPLGSRVGMPTSSGATKKGLVISEEIEPLNPTLKFKVVTKSDGAPAPDVKVVLKQRTGISFHQKFTDFNGEVTFSNIEGYSNDYSPSVEGDENKEVFRVILI